MRDVRRVFVAFNFNYELKRWPIAFPINFYPEFVHICEIFHLQRFLNLQHVGSDLDWARKQEENDAHAETREETKVFLSNEAETLDLNQFMISAWL